MIILFDMDGTITPARQPMSRVVAEKLGELSKKIDIGIVTGSGLNYVLEQCGILKSIINIDWKRIHLLPCNGTQWYQINEEGKAECLHSANMKAEVGTEPFRTLVSLLCYEQSIVCASFEQLDLFGTFIQYRGSLLNWCPMGRDGDYDAPAREKFIQFDNETSFRQNKLRDLSKHLDRDGIVITLGGLTSFDIYPKGWDKTYSLQHFLSQHGRIVFIGDKCRGDGNDRTIYEACYPDAHETSGPTNTMELIQQFLDEL